MRSGELRHEIVIESQLPVKSGAYSAPEWSEAFRLMATWKEEGGEEIETSETLMARRRGYWMARWVPGVDETMRVTFNDGEKIRLYQITNVENVGERNWTMKIHGYEVPREENAG